MKNISMLSQDNSNPVSSSPDQPTTHFVTNGAPSGEIVEHIASWVVLLAETGHIPIQKLDAVLHADAESLRAMLTSVDICDPEVVDMIFLFIKSKNANDHVGYLKATKALVTNPFSPFCLTKRTGTSFTLPPPTVHDAQVYSEVVPQVTENSRSRAQAFARASQLISSYKLYTFDESNDAHKYLEWKYDVLDVCNTDECYLTKTEIVLNCISANTRLAMLRVITNLSPRETFNGIWEHLDKQFLNFRAIRHVESCYMTCKMENTESLSSFHARFLRFARLYENCRNTLLSDRDKIVSFGSGLNNKYAFFSGLIESSHDSLTFAEFSQKLMYLTSASAVNLNSTSVEREQFEADFSQIETRGSKRNRSDEAGNTSRPQRYGLGCYRCQLGNHIALDCTGKIKDYETRCHRCGSRKHSLPQCKAQVKRGCRRCGSTHHFESICPKEISKAEKTGDKIKKKVNFASNDAVSVHEFDQLRSILENDAALSTIDCEFACGSVTTDIVDNTAPLLPVRFSAASTPHSGLADSGAAASFISVDLVREMVKTKIINPDDVFKLQPAIRIRFGNSHTFKTDMALRSKIYISGDSFNAVFLICPDLNPKLIVGRPLLKVLGLLPKCSVFTSEDNIECLSTTVQSENKADSITDHSNDAATDSTDLMISNHGPESDVSENYAQEKGTSEIPWVQVQQEGEKKKLFIRFPLFENVMMEPLREPLRSYSKTTEQIILERLIFMTAEGSCVECSLEDIRVVVPIVLVDKKPQQIRTYPDQTVHQRYRITFDLRGYNRLKLHASSDGQFVLIPQALSEIESKPKSGADQFQRSSFEILRRIPVDKCYLFSKVDISNAYQSAYLMPSMQHVGCETYDYSQGIYRYFRCTTLCQGWKYSPTLFRMCSMFLVNQCRENFKELREFVHIDFFQDDILICSGPNARDQLIRATSIAIETLRSFSLTVREDKIVVAAPEIIFCGYLLTEYTCKPYPTRRKLDIELSDKLWQSFNQSYPEDKDGVIHWVRSLCGMVQYLYGFLNSDSLEALQELYRLSSDKNKTAPLEVYEKNFRTLVSYVCNGLPLFYLGHSEKIVCTLVISDANCNSWSSLILKLIRCDVFHDSQTPHSASNCMPELREALNDAGIDSDKCVIIPVRICGNKFNTSMRKQSSTARERFAVLQTIHEIEPLLEGTTIVIADNRNCSKTWHSIEDLGADLIRKWQKYCQFVDRTLWLPRDSYPRLADTIARLLDTDVPIVHANSADATTESENVSADISKAYEADDTTFFDMPIRDIYAGKLLERDGLGIDHLGNEIRKALKFFEIDSRNLLWYLSGNRKRLYIPNCTTSHIPHGDKGIRIGLLHAAHCPLDIHVGIERTIVNLARFWWPNWHKDIVAFVSSCWTCTTVKTRAVKSHFDSSILSTTKDLSRPFQGWFIDHFGPYGTESSKYGLVCICGFSKYCYATEVDSVDAVTTARELVKLFAIFGIPTMIHTDRGSSFTSDLNSEICSLLKIDKRYSPVSFPRCNGVCERLNGTLKSMLRTLNFANASISIRLCCLIQNSMPMKAHKWSPLEIALGFRPRILSDVYFDHPEVFNPFSGEIQYFLRKAHAFVSEEFGQSAVIESALLNKASIVFQPGDMVIKVVGGNAIKHTIVDGPYILLNQVAGNIWRMFKLERSLDAFVVECPVSLLKRYECMEGVRDLPYGPPVPKPAPDLLKKFDLIIAKDPDPSSKTVGLYEVMTNDSRAKIILAKVWRCNTIMEFFATEKLVSISYDSILIGKFKLVSRMIPVTIQNVAFHILGGRL